MKYETNLIDKSDNDVFIVASYDFEPEQKQIIHPVDIAQEGISASCCVFEIVDVDGNDILDTFDHNALESLEEEIIELLTRDSEPDYESMAQDIEFYGDY